MIVVELEKQKFAIELQPNNNGITVELVNNGDTVSVIARHTMEIRVVRYRDTAKL